MVTTVDLDPEAYRLAEALAAKRRQSIGKVLSDAILLGQHSTLEGEPSVTRGSSGLPEIRFGEPTTLDEVQQAIEED
jgi:hypothetical protein